MGSLREQALLEGALRRMKVTQKPFRKSLLHVNLPIQECRSGILFVRRLRYSLLGSGTWALALHVDKFSRKQYTFRYNGNFS